MEIHKKIVIDEHGRPQEGIIADILGLDLGIDAQEDLRQARADRAQGNHDAYIDLDDLP